MVYDELKVVFAILVIILALVLLAIVNSEPSRTEPSRTEREGAAGAAYVRGTMYDVGLGSKAPAARERREGIEWACWCEEWADVREAQAEYLERRGE